MCALKYGWLLKRNAILLMVRNSSSALYALLKNYLVQLISVSLTRYWRNVFDDYPENILTAMIHDPEQHVKKLG